MMNFLKKVKDGVLLILGVLVIVLLVAFVSPTKPTDTKHKGKNLLLFVSNDMYDIKRTILKYNELNYVVVSITPQVVSSHYSDSKGDILLIMELR